MSKLITDNDLKNILNEILPLDNDSGWIQATLTSEFTQYGTDNVAKYRRIGNIVQVTGIIKPTASLTANDTWHTIFTLPEGYAPPNVIINLMQGSGNAMWACAVNADGQVRFARYRDLSVTTGGGYVSPGTSTWLPFSITFMVAGGDVSVGHSSAADYVVEEGTSGIWTYRKWNNGIAECWGRTEVASNTYAASGGYKQIVENLPSGLFTSVDSVIADGGITEVIQSDIGYTGIDSTSAIQTYLVNRYTSSVTKTGRVFWQVKGTWK